MSAGLFAQDAPVYHRTGLNVLPIVPGTKQPPAGVSWRRWQTRRQTADELDRLLDAHSGADVGLILGGPVGLVDVETDGSHGERALREIRLPVPATGCFASPRGTHRLYRASCSLPSRIGLRPGLDVLAASRYVVAPRSRGREWLTPAGLDELAPLPEAWEEMLSVGSERLTGETLHVMERAGAAEGSRNITLASLVGSWLTSGAPEAEVMRRAHRFAQECRPPLDVREAEGVVASVLRTRERLRSPEGKALLRARDLGLDPADRLVLVALETHRREVGVPPGGEFVAPTRMIARLTGLGLASVFRAYRRLSASELIALSTTRDPTSGRKVVVVRFLSPFHCGT